MQAADFLSAVAGYTRATAGGDQSPRLATIDPAYSSASYPGTMPKVTFDGEPTLSGKRYAVIGSYVPTAGDRVLMDPIGSTYVIAGALDSDASARVGGALAVVGDLTLSGALVCDTWHAISNASMLNSWVNRGSGYASLAYRKVTADEVKIIGNVIGGTYTGGTAIAQLPTGYRPTATQSLSAAGATSNTTTSTPTIQVDTSGYIRVWYMTSPGGYTEINGSISLTAPSA